ncbi:MAG: ankyrin repeat domain-containing protein [Alphaproteobacteria bacterium]|nr:MAG: ankyrin repeat domain-containing protein [Alphaproteobacteria bacterium]
MTIVPCEEPIIDAARDGDIEAVRAELAARVDPDTADSMNRSALYHAAYAGREDIVKLLIEKNADVNLEDDEGETPLIAALENKHFSIAALLLENGADINTVSGRQQQTPLHWAFNMDMDEKKTDRVIWLLEKGAEVTRKGGGGLDVMQRGREYAIQWPFAGEIVAAMKEYIRTHDPAYIFEQQMKQASADMCEALREGLPEAMAIKPIRLKLAPKPS